MHFKDVWVRSMYISHVCTRERFMFIYLYAWTYMIYIVFAVMRKCTHTHLKHTSTHKNTRTGKQLSSRVHLRVRMCLVTRVLVPNIDYQSKHVRKVLLGFTLRFADISECVPVSWFKMYASTHNYIIFSHRNCALYPFCNTHIRVYIYIYAHTNINIYVYDRCVCIHKW